MCSPNHTTLQIQSPLFSQNIKYPWSLFVYGVIRLIYRHPFSVSVIYIQIFSGFSSGIETEFHKLHAEHFSSGFLWKRLHYKRAQCFCCTRRWETERLQHPLGSGKYSRIFAQSFRKVVPCFVKLDIPLKENDRTICSYCSNNYMVQRWMESVDYGWRERPTREVCIVSSVASTRQRQQNVWELSL